MTPAHVAVEFDSSGFVFLLAVVPAGVEAGAFVGSKPAAAATSRAKMPVARIVCIAEHSFVVMVGIAVHKYVGVVAVLASVSALYVAHPAFLEFFFSPMSSTVSSLPSSIPVCLV